MEYQHVLESTIEEAAHPMEQEHVYHAISGVDQSTEGKHAPNNLSDISASFQIPVPSRELILDSCLYVQFEVEVVLTKATSDITDMEIQRLSVHSFPVNNLIESCNLKINNYSNLHYNSDLKPLQERLLSMETKRDHLSGSPYVPEPDTTWGNIITSRNYDGHPIGAELPNALNGTPAILYRSQQMVGGDYRSNRAAYYRIKDITSPNPAVVGLVRNIATVIYTFYEPLFHPLLSQIPGQRGLYNIQNYLGLELKFVSNRRNAVFYDQELVIPFNVVFPTSGNGLAFNILTRTISPSTVELSQNRIYPFPKYLRQIGGTKTLVDLADLKKDTTFTYTAPTTTVPEMIVIYAAKRRNFAHINQLDMTSLVIKTLRVKVMNQAGLFSSADPFQLYQMSVRNGLQMDYYTWLRGGKCVILIKPGQDFGNVMPSSNVNFNIEIQATFVAPSSNNFTAGTAGGVADAGYDLAADIGQTGDYELNVVLVTQNFLSFNGFQVTEVEGFSAQDSASSLESPPDHVGDNFKSQGEVEFGKFNFKKFVKKAWRGVTRWLPAVTMHAKLLSNLAPNNPVVQGSMKYLDNVNETVRDANDLFKKNPPNKLALMAARDVNREMFNPGPDSITGGQRLGSGMRRLK